MADLKLLTEDVIALSQVRNFLPKIEGGKRPHASTIWRWSLRGIGGVKLETAKIGSQIVTSKQAVTRFIAATTDQRK